MTRRRFAAASLASTAFASPLLAYPVHADTASAFKFKYLLSSCLYGRASLAEILPEVSRTAATAIDIWPEVHGNQREQLAEMGEQEFAKLLEQHAIQLGCITQYKLGPFGLQEEMRLAARLGCHTIVTGGEGPRGLTGSELKSAVQNFVEKMKPHLAVALASEVSIAIENHANNLIESPDSLKWLAEFSAKAGSEGEQLGIALAPYHFAPRFSSTCEFD